LDEREENSATVYRTPLGYQIAALLRRDILLGRLKPGTHLPQRKLCEQFGTSRMPIRDALRELSHAGLVTTDAGRHIVVARLSRTDMLDSFAIEGVLTGMTTRRTSENITDDQFKQIEALHSGMLEAAKSQDADAMVKLNWNFHRNINQWSGSRKLLAAIRSVSLDLPRDYLAFLPERNEESNAEHAGILQAMRAGEHDRAADLMSRHVTDAGQALIEYLKSQGLELT
jgi:DNA-binding GntR family transcriptional regulator